MHHAYCKVKQASRSFSNIAIYFERKFHLATGYAASTKAMVSLIPDVARAARRAGGTRLRTFGSNKLTFVLSAHPTPIRL